MANLTWMVPVWCAAVLAQPLIDNGPAADDGAVKLHVEAKTSSSDLWAPLANVCVTAIDCGSVSVAARWGERGMDEIEASIRWWYDARHRQPVESMTLSLKSRFREVWLPWYLRGEVGVDSTPADQQGVWLIATDCDGAGARIFGSVGITRRGTTSAARHYRESSIVHAEWQWRCDDRLGVGINVKYFLDAQNVESLFYLHIGPPWHAP